MGDAKKQGGKNDPNQFKNEPGNQTGGPHKIDPPTQPKKDKK